MKDKYKTKKQLIEELVELRQQIEEILRISETKYCELYDNALDMYHSIDKNGIIVDCNETEARMLGYRKEEIIGRPLVDFFTEESKRLFEIQFPILNEEKGQLSLEREFVRKDGTTFIASLNIFSERDEKGKFVRTRTIARDITDLKQIENALRDSEKNYRDLVDNALVGVFKTNLKGNILYVNKALSNMLGFETLEEMKAGGVLVKYKNLKDRLVLIETLMKRGKVESFEVELLTKKGKTKSVLISAILDKDIISGMIMDITERKLAEEALRESESKFRTLAQTNAAAIFIIQGNNFKYVNPALELISGYPVEELMTMNFWDLVHPEFQELVKERGLARQRGEKVPSRYEFKIITKNGETCWLDTTAGVLDYEGEPATIAVAIEITNRKQAETARLESEEKFRAISSTAVDAILVMDDNGRISYWNPSAERIFGYTSEEAIGKELHLFLAPRRYHEAYMEGFKKFRETGQGPAIGKTSEFYAVRKDGTEFPIEVSTSAIQVKGKWHSVGVVRDITARKIAERAVRESEQNYRALFEESKDVIYISTPEGKFLDINPAGIELFRYPSKEEFLQIDITHDLYISPVDREKLQKVLTRQGYVKDYEVVFRRKDGEYVTVLLTSTIVRDEQGEIVAYRGIMKDITERKKLEEQLLQAQKMEAIGQLAGGIAHDFNNILTAIIGFANLLKTETSKDDILRSYVTPILNSAERAANLTQALLAFSRRQIISPKPVNLNEIIQRLERLLSMVIGEDIELSTMLTDRDSIIMADSGQIEQVLMNLATNARDSMPDGGKLTISTKLVELDSEFIKTHGFGRPGAYVLVSVEDTGRGIDEKTKGRIFEPFFTTKEVGKGTGLGLAMVYGIIKQHEGYINLYSEQDTGTIFNIYLPLIKSEVEETKLEDLLVLKGGVETVLVAEDDEPVRDLIKEVLSGYGYKVMEAGDGEEAVSRFKENKDKIQLLILDVIMPKKNGKEAYDEIKVIKPDIKAIFTSGYNADIIHKKGILDEGLDFILKPISPDGLLRKMREVLDK
jgi:two-component system cell cycle sensor histidine kinase/response regulator CckA